MKGASVEYPSLREAANAASASAQYWFLSLNKAQLLILTLTAVVSAWTPPDQENQRVAAIGTFVLMFTALGIATGLRLTKFDDRWFRCRALAENLKSAVWHFVMSPAASVKETEATYLAQVAELRNRLEHVVKEVMLYDTNGPLITSWMKSAQQLPLDQKLQLFRKARLEDQSKWYHGKSQWNAKWEKRWFLTVFIAEFIAVAFTALQAWKLWEFNAVGPIATMSAGLIAWMQTKRFSDLALSYGIAAADLRHIGAKWEHAATEAEVQTFVNEVETAISREHSLWLSRRTT